jgi:hypothetical protein|tara:strand:+ start:652 stop:828 length:177 start_codon:yes stop_codon:yes gene_type:complete
MSIAEFQQEYFDYLVELRDSGVTNMWGAGPYLEDKFWLTKQEAKDVLVAWIKSFEEEA